MDVKKYVKHKGIGFWFSVAVTLLSLVTAIVYVSCYAGTDNINWGAFALLLVSFVAGGALIALNRYKWAPYAQAVLVFVSLLLFIYGIYYYVSVVMVGIDADSFDASFIINAIFFIVTFGLSVANLFLNPEKSESKGAENESKN